MEDLTINSKALEVMIGVPEGSEWFREREQPAGAGCNFKYKGGFPQRWRLSWALKEVRSVPALLGGVMFQDHHLPKPGALLGKHWGYSRNWSGPTSGRTSCRGLWGSKFAYLMPSSYLCLEIHETLKIRGGRRACEWSKVGSGRRKLRWGPAPTLCSSSPESSVRWTQGHWLASKNWPPNGSEN